MRLATATLLACLGFIPLNAPCADAGKAVDPNKVEIHVEHGIPLPWGSPAFRIEISGWQPDGDLVLYAIAPDGNKLALVPEDKAVQADENGSLTLDIDYSRKGLAPGHWVFLAAGKPGVHEFETDLPRVEPPTAKHKKWRLVFGTQDAAKQPANAR